MLTQIPVRPRLLGLAGLLPMIACVLAAHLGGEQWRWTALAVGFGYGAVIFSFLGGLWWGIAAAADLRGGGGAPGWLWGASVVPSLMAFAAYLPWVFGLEWPGPSLVLIGVGLIAAPLVDGVLVRAGLVPGWWLALCRALSWGLGALTLALAFAAP